MTKPDAPRLPDDLDPARIPAHVAIIMDGNGRWARERGLERAAGHRAGAESVRRALRACEAAGVGTLTLFSFSTENWKRPDDEVAALMGLLKELVAAETDAMRKRNLRLRVIGRTGELPDDVRSALEGAVELTSACTGATLCLALNYGARAEIADAARAIAEDAAAGKLDPADVDEAAVASRLYTVGLPDPDLLIRTAGERRISNFLLWQISYAEIHVTDVRWPEFGEEQFFEAIRDYQSRERRFGNSVAGAESRA